jgi:hypothetical protein
MKKPFAMAIILSALLSGCGESPQEKAYHEALKSEAAAAMTISSAAPSLIANYSHVIDLDPKTEWAVKSQNRIKLLREIMQEDQNAQGSAAGR